MNEKAGGCRCCRDTGAGGNPLSPAQPFADLPTDHWAYDGIAELAAKGLIEGYPDGAFRGDRAMTRYEMAMVVARLLARIEAIKIPPLPTDLTGGYPGAARQYPDHR